MRADPDNLTGLARFLLQPEPIGSAADLVRRWREGELRLRLAGIGKCVRPDFGAHLRRSFLGALAAGASGPARAGLPCPWDPPCAFDVFRREQISIGPGRGLPKPYTFVFRPHGEDLLISLRVFGIACDWLPAAAEGLIAGLAMHLPWAREVKGVQAMPPVLARELRPVDLEPAFPEGRLRLHLLTPAEVPETWSLAPGHLGAQICRLAIARTEAMARWQALTLAPEALARLAAAADTIMAEVSGLSEARHLSPNRRGEARKDRALSGWVDLIGDLTELGPVFQIVERCNLGRKANEGLGSLLLEVPHGRC